jgi:hypothetical protein
VQAWVSIVRLTFCSCKKYVIDSKKLQFLRKEGQGVLAHAAIPPQAGKPDFYPHFTNGFCETASQARQYGRVFHNLCNLEPLYKRPIKMWVKDRLESRGLLAALR